MTDAGTFDIKESITNSVTNLFDTMLDMEATPSPEKEIGITPGK